MITVVDWLLPAAVGVTFTLLGSLRLWGLSRGIVGGADKPVVPQHCGTSPTWESRSLRLGLPSLLLGLGGSPLGLSGEVGAFRRMPHLSEKMRTSWACMGTVKVAVSLATVVPVVRSVTVDFSRSRKVRGAVLDPAARVR